MKRWFNLRLIAFVLFAFALIVCSVFSAVWYFIIYPSSIANGNGINKSEVRQLNTFKKIVVNNPVSVVLAETSGNESAEVVAEDNLLTKVKTIVSGDTLYIEFEKVGILNLPMIKPSKEIAVKINYKNIESIDLQNTVNLTTENRLRTDKLTLKVIKDSEADIDIFTNEFNVTISGASSKLVKVQGSAKVQNIKITGNDVYEAGELESKEVRIDINGEASAEIRADEALDITLNGSGKIEYRGNPKKLNQQISGQGSVTQIKE